MRFISPGFAAPQHPVEQAARLSEPESCCEKGTSNQIPENAEDPNAQIPEQFKLDDSGKNVGTDDDAHQEKQRVGSIESTKRMPEAVI